MYIICSLEPIIKIYEGIVKDDYSVIENANEKEDITKKDIRSLEKIIQKQDDMIEKEDLKDLSADTLLDIAIELYIEDAIDYLTYNRMMLDALSRF